MPSHPKHKKIKPDKEELQGQSHKHARGSFKRKGASAKEWEDVVGPSLDSLPVHQLPTVRTVLQRYRALRIERKSDLTNKLADAIATEAEAIWQKARVPTREHHNIVKAVMDIIDIWKKSHNHGELSMKLSGRLDVLLDLKPKLKGKVTEEAQLENLKTLMKRQSPSWLTDYNFYLDQYSGARLQHLGAADLTLHKKEMAREERETKRAKYYAEQQASQAR